MLVIVWYSLGVFSMSCQGKGIRLNGSTKTRPFNSRLNLILNKLSCYKFNQSIYPTSKTYQKRKNPPKKKTPD